MVITSLKFFIIVRQSLKRFASIVYDIGVFLMAKNKLIKKNIFLTMTFLNLHNQLCSIMNIT